MPQKRTAMSTCPGGGLPASSKRCGTSGAPGSMAAHACTSCALVLISRGATLTAARRIAAQSSMLDLMDLLGAIRPRSLASDSASSWRLNSFLYARLICAV